VTGPAAGDGGGGGPRVRIAGLGLWLPGHPTLSSWLEGRPDPEETKPRGGALDRVNRRRASLLGRALADAAAEAMAAAKVDPAAVPAVIGSSIAEASTMLGLLDQIWRTREPVSPAAFTVSVHNAASGLMSISNANRGFTTSLAADEDTPAMALLEAIGLVATTGRPAVVACGDEAVPRDLVPEAESWGLLAAAVALAPLDGDGPCRALLRVTRDRAATLGGARVLAGARVDGPFGRHPQVGLLDLVDAVARGEPGVVRLDRGTGRGYCAEIEPA